MSARFPGVPALPPDPAVAVVGSVVFPAPVVGFAGSRWLPDSARPIVGRLVRAALAADRGVAVGCAVGADAFALEAALAARAAARLSVFCAFGPGGVGAGPWSALSPVAAAAASGASVRWWAGGGEAVALRSRLSARSLALVSFLAARPGSSLVVFLASPRPRGGSWLTLRAAVRSGVRVVVFPVGFPAGRLASLGRGAWVPCSLAGVSGGWRWEPEAAAAAWLSPEAAAAAGWRVRRLPRGRASEFADGVFASWREEADVEPVGDVVRVRAAR